MTIEETILIIAIILLSTGLNALFIRKILQIFAGLTIEKIENLNEDLKEAIAFISEGNIGGFEAPNPIVGMITQALQNKMDQSPIDATVLRADNGKFKKLDQDIS